MGAKFPEIPQDPHPTPLYPNIGILSRLWQIAKNNKKYAIFDFFLYGRWEDLDRWKWVVIDVGVILDAFASHSENFFFRHFLS